MNKTITIEKLRPYIWASSIFFLTSFSHSLTQRVDAFFELLFNNLWHIAYIIVINFILFEYSVPFVFRKRKLLLYNIFLGIIISGFYLFLYSCGAYLWREIGIAFHIYRPLGTYKKLNLQLEDQMAYSMGSVFFFGVIRHIYYYIRLKQATQQLRIEKQEAELNYLRSQTNPHFLFNTLNNIYSLTRDKSDLAPESVLRLSKILRFMLYETKGDYISIEEELKVISDYIELEKLRYDESLRVSFAYDVENMKQAIPPLLLIPLVENAFKHGVSETRVSPFVDFHLSVNNRQLKFTVKNSTGAAGTEMGITENIGLSNLRRQLELLYKEYDLSVQHSNSIFTVVLKINLASHV